jgi:hypothetical protein
MPERKASPLFYLRVIGRLSLDGRLRLRPCYLTTDAPWSDREGAVDSPLVVELIGHSARALGTYPLRVSSGCAYGGRQIADAVRGWVPFHPDTQTVRFVLRGRVVHEIQRSPHPPRVRLTWRPPERVEGKQRVTWEAAGGQPDTDVEYFVRYSHTAGRKWQRVGWRTKGTEATIDFDQLPGGERCLIAIVATDGINTVTVESDRFAVAVKPCVAIVIAPIDGARAPSGVSVELRGQGYWMEEARVERERLRWTSSVDGDLGRGAHLRVERLSEGHHRITLVAGERDREGTQSVAIYVGPSRDPAIAS